MKIPAIAVTIDGVTYRSYTAAARAYGIDHKRVGRLAKKANGAPLTAADMQGLRLLTAPPEVQLPPKTKAKTSPLSWQFVYDRITSSPKSRSVGSHPAVS